MKQSLVNFFLNEKNILVIIILNAICIYLQGFRDYTKISHLAYNIDHIITFIFIFEMLIKIHHYGWSKYISQGWNKLDFILVVASFPSILDYAFDISFIDISIVLIFRLLRLFRFLRILQFIPGIEKILEGSIRALKSSIMIIAIFITILFLFSVSANNIFYEKSPEMFGTPSKSLYTTFKIFTIEGWYDIADEIAGKYGGIAHSAVILFFVSILFVGGIIGLSLINSVFVDAMVMDNNQDLETKVDELKQEIQHLKELISKQKE